jgi:thiopeptide-type bacteriocin biosynthesis protein
LCAANAVDQGDLRRALDSDLQILRTRLQQVLREACVVDAIFVASPSLEQSLFHWLEAPSSDKGRRAERALTKYFARMAARPTPFGLFSGCSVGRVADEPHLELGPRGAYRRHTRPDMNFLTDLVDGLNRDPALRSTLRFRVNSSLYQIGNRIQYLESRRSGRWRNYYLMSAIADEPLAATLVRAAGGATLDALAAALVGPDVEIDEAMDYVTELIDAQILVSELAPAVTGAECLDDLLNQLHDKPSATDVHAKLDSLRTSLQEVDSGGVGTSPSRYRDIAASLRGVPAEVDIGLLFQVDLTKPSTCLQLGPEVAADMLAGVQVLHDLFGNASKDGLDEFRAGFRDRYGDREVPLVEVLDEEVGIGFRKSSMPGSEASPLLEGLDFPPPAPDRTATMNATSLLLHRKLMASLAAGSQEIVLEDDDLKPFRRQTRPPLPDAFEVMGAVLPPGPEDSGGPRHRVVVKWMWGPPGVRLLGRFCHADPQLRDLVEAHVAREEALRPDAIFFEIVHLPEGRIGNIIARPVLRAHELAFLGKSGADPDRQLGITDLLISLEGDRIVLKSRSLGCEVLPRFTAAHNTERYTIGAYRFLAALQQQGVASKLTWTWGPLAQLPFLPRVRYGRVIFDRRTWVVSEEEIDALSKGDDFERFRQVREWQRRRQLPRYVGLTDGDNVLPVDLENCLSIDAFVAAVARRSNLTVQEMLPGPDSLACAGPEGGFCNEIVVPFIRRLPTGPVGRAAGTSAAAAASSTLARQNAAPTASVPRRRPPGSDWLYLKVYCGESTADVVLRDVVRALVEEAMSTRLVESWFFLRYADPHRHLRLRFRGQPDRLTSELLPMGERLLRPLLEDGRVWKLQLDTYEREVQRYGGECSIELAESIFHADSDAACEILSMLDEERAADDRWRATLLGIDRLLEDFDFDLPRRFLLVHDLAAAMAKELGLEGRLKDQVLAKYRKERAGLEQLLAQGSEDARTPHPAAAHFERRSQRLRPLTAEMNRLAGAGKLTASLHKIVSSLIHMHTNRLLRGSSRVQEGVLYQFLDRHYDSCLARRGIKGEKRQELRLEP